MIEVTVIGAHVVHEDAVGGQVLMVLPHPRCDVPALAGRSWGTATPGDGSALAALTGHLSLLQTDRHRAMSVVGARGYLPVEHDDLTGEPVTYGWTDDGRRVIALDRDDVLTEALDLDRQAITWTELERSASVRVSVYGVPLLDPPATR